MVLRLVLCGINMIGSAIVLIWTLAADHDYHPNTPKENIGLDQQSNSSGKGFK